MGVKVDDNTGSERLYDATARLAAIVKCSEDAIICLTMDGLITEWNDGASRLYGYSAEEVIGKHISLLAPPTLVEETMGMLSKVFTGEKLQRVETVRLRKDGSAVNISFSMFPIVGWDGVIAEVSTIAHDITSRKTSALALSQSEERFQLVARATNDVIWDWDIKSGKVWRSETFWKHFRYPPRDAEPDMAHWKDLIHPEDQDRVWNGFQNALLRQADSYEVEYRFRQADDSYAVVLDRAYIVYDEAGQPTRAIGAITDLSDRRILEEQFRQAQKMEAVGRLAGGVAHDFNNLLMVISSYACMAQDNLGPEDGTIRSHLEQVRKASEKAAALTHQLLAFSRKQVLVLRTIDLNAVVEDTLKMVKRLIGEDIELTVSLANGLWAITADPSQIVQVLMNLCVNARDAMPNSGRLTVETHNLSVNAESARERPALLPADYAVLIVSDTGTGMTKEVQGHIFEPFYTTKGLEKGTGLGLSTVYGIVKQSGGYIWVESEPGRGSSFTIYLPAVEAPLTTTAASETTVAEGQGEIVLLVEDEEALREAISTFLNLHGYTVLEAGSGEQALQIASEHGKLIHVLLTDIILTKMSGTELAQELATKCPDIVTIYMSGYTDRAVYGLESATVGFLQKPFLLETLLQKLREMIAMRH